MCDDALNSLLCALSDSYVTATNTSLYINEPNVRVRKNHYGREGHRVDIHMRPGAYVKAKLFEPGCDFEGDDLPVMFVLGREQKCPTHAGVSTELSCMDSTYDEGITDVSKLLALQKAGVRLTIDDSTSTNRNSDTENSWFERVLDALRDLNVDVRHGHRCFAGFRTGPTAYFTPSTLIDVSTRGADVRIYFSDIDESSQSLHTIMEVTVVVAPDFMHMAETFLYPMLTPDDFACSEDDVHDHRFCGWCYCEPSRGSCNGDHRCIHVCYKDEMELAVSHVLEMLQRMLRMCPLCKVSRMVDCCKLCPHAAARRIQWAWKRHMYHPLNPRQIERLCMEFEDLTTTVCCSARCSG